MLFPPAAHSSIGATLAPMREDSPPDVAADRRTTADDWLPDAYELLRVLAGRALRRERASATLQPTLLVHEAYLRLAAGESRARFPDREEFLAAAGRALREVLVDHARRRDAAKRGGRWSRVTLSRPDLAAPAPALDLLDLEEALGELRADHARAARVVESRVFGGLTIEETATLLAVSPRTVNLDWRFARAWLDRRLRPEEDE